MKENPEKYLYCPEARIIRFEHGKTHYQGICTDGVTICAVFCYQSADKQRLSLIHVNHLTTKATLLEEAQWIGKDGHCRVYTRNQEQRELETNAIISVPGLDLLKNLDVSSSCEYTVQIIDSNVDGFIFKSNGDVNLISNLNGIDCIYHPNQSQLYICHKLHADLSYNRWLGFLFTENNQLRQQLIIFDGKDWQEVKSHDLVLHPEMKKLLRDYNFSRSETFLSIQRVFLNDHRLKLIRNIPSFEKATDLEKAWAKLSPNNRKLVNEKMCGDIQHSVAGIARNLICYLYRNNLKQGFVNSIRDELRIDPFAKTQADKALHKSIIAALASNDPVDSVYNLLKPLQRDTEFKSNIIGLVLGAGGFLSMYNQGSKGKWIDLSSVENEICDCDTIGLAFRTVAANGTVKQLKDLAQIVHNIDASGKSGRTALHFAASQNTSEMVSCLLELGCNSELTDETGQKPINNCATPESKALLEAHSAKMELT